MKTHRLFSSNRLVPHLRTASVVTLMSAATAMAFVAVNPSGPLWAKSNNKNAINTFGQNRASFRNKLALPGPEREAGPAAAAEEDYVNRAGPAPYVPFELTRKAHAAWGNVRARAVGKNATALGSWTLAGPSTAPFPDVLTFSGAAYTTSGRITALAVDPSCNARRCRAWAAAAGGGVWRTDKALANSELAGHLCRGASPRMR